MRSALPLIAAEIGVLLDPVRRILADRSPPHELMRLLRGAGWSLPGIGSVDLDALLGELETVIATVDALPDAVRGGSLPELAASLEATAEALAALRRLDDAFAGLLTLLDLDVSPAAAAALAEDVAHALVMTWLARRGPAALALMRALDVVTYEASTTMTAQDGTVLRSTTPRPRLRLDGLPGLLADPVAMLQASVAYTGLADSRDAQALALLLGSRARRFAMQLGGGVAVWAPWGWLNELPEPERDAAARTLSAWLPLPMPEGTAARPELAAEIELLGPTDVGRLGHPGPGLELRPSGLAPLTATSGRWTFDLAVASTVDAIFVGPQAVAGGGTLSASVALVYGGEEPVALGAENGTRLELGVPTIALGVELVDSPDVSVALTLTDVALVIAPGDGDSFVAGALAGVELNAGFDLGLTWSRRGGLRLSGASSGLGFRVPVERTIGGVVTLHWVDVALLLADDVELALSAAATVTLGPFAATVEGSGLRIGVGFPPGRDGNLGPVDLSLAFKAPTGVAFVLDLGDVGHGGGFVAHDPETGRYAGGLALDIFGFGLSAIVIVDTELPGDPDGWALFGSLGLEFATPIPLGFGFTLIGVGGLLALNRTLDVDGLAADLRTGAADAILFPDDFEEDADAVLAGLDTWFPTAEGSSVFGPVVQIGWGSPTIVTAQLGVVVALPDLIVSLLGSVEVLLPTPDAPVLSLRMDVLGAVDVPAGIVIVAASLHDSNLLGVFELSGDMGFYLALSGQPLFVLSVGGYHPQFDPPGALPAWLLDLRRTRAAVELGEGVEVVLTSYVAVTSNTLQFGGAFRLEARVDVLLTTYSAEGWFSINVLLVLKPFKLVARASAGVSISAGDKELLGVDLSARLEGPEPWYATGRASFTFFGFDVEFGFEIGEQAGGEPREIHDVAADVVAALAAPGAWQTCEPGDAWASGVVMSDERPAGLWVRPDQLVELRQSVAPLNRTMTAYGEFTPALALIEAEAVTLAGAAVTAPEWIEDFFAPAQFDRLGDTERLSAPSYELMTAGVRFGAAGVGIPADLAGECASVSRAPEESIFPDHDPPPSGHVCTARPAALASTTRTLANDRLVVRATTYTVVRVADGLRADVVLGKAGSALAYADACAVVSGQPVAERSKLRVAPSHAAGERVAA